MNIGILSVQGAFIEHEKILRELGANVKEIRQKSDLKGIHGIILPGGESTVQGKLLRQLDIMDELREMIRQGLPTLATCAGLILLAKKILNDDAVYLGTLPVTVKRNAYGRQLSSFQTTHPLGGFGDFPMTFIRAPYITQAEKDVNVLAELDEKIVAVKYKNQIGLSFHPELSDDFRIHSFFLHEL